MPTDPLDYDEQRAATTICVLHAEIVRLRAALEHPDLQWLLMNVTYGDISASHAPDLIRILNAVAAVECALKGEPLPEAISTETIERIIQDRDYRWRNEEAAEALDQTEKALAQLRAALKGETQ